MNGQQRREEKIITKFNKVNITLFECQIDLLLDSLVVYGYDTNEKYSNRKLAKSKLFPQSLKTILFGIFSFE